MCLPLGSLFLGVALSASSNPEEQRQRLGIKPTHDKLPGKLKELTCGRRRCDDRDGP